MLVYLGFLFEFFAHQIIYGALGALGSCDQQLKIAYVSADSDAVFHEESESVSLLSPRPTVAELRSFLCRSTDWNCAKLVRAQNIGVSVSRKRCVSDTYVLGEK